MTKEVLKLALAALKSCGYSDTGSREPGFDEDIVEAAIITIEQALSEKVEPMLWQPIETAPKDFVSVIDGWNGDRVPDITWAKPDNSPKGYYAWCYSQYENGYGWALIEVKGLTHWIPIPNGPTKD